MFTSSSALAYGVRHGARCTILDTLVATPRDRAAATAGGFKTPVAAIPDRNPINFAYWTRLLILFFMHDAVYDTIYANFASGVRQARGTPNRRRRGNLKSLLVPNDALTCNHGLLVFVLNVQRCAMTTLLPADPRPRQTRRP